VAAAALMLGAAPYGRAVADDAKVADYPAAQCPKGSDNPCVKSYVAAANGEISRVQDDAAARIKQAMAQADARIKQLRQGPPDDTATAEIKQVQAQEAESLGKIGTAADDSIQRINARIRQATEPVQTASAAPRAAPAVGTPGLESVTVTAARPTPEAISSFILSHGAGTRLTGKLARWRMGICPRAEGLTPQDAAYVAQRIRDVAASVGAPVNKDPACKTNIRIVFTPAPQDFLDSVRKENRDALGYADTLRQGARLATTTRAIQAFYVTATQDVRGNRELDTPRPMTGLTIDMPAYFNSSTGGNALAQGSITLTLPSARMKAVTGNRLDDGLSSEFDHILIVAEPAKLKAVQARSLADYMAVLGLSQPDAVDVCETLPSIVNLLTPGCQTVTSSITDGDIAYLRGLYKMTAAASLQVQRTEVRYQMEQALKKGD
jgi:hypothetical protein